MADDRINVLLVENSPMAAAMVQGMLAEERSVPIDVECAACLSECLKRLTLQGIDLLLLDLTLPDSQGLETFTHAHAHAPQSADHCSHGSRWLERGYRSGP